MRDRPSHVNFGHGLGREPVATCPSAGSFSTAAAKDPAAVSLPPAIRIRNPEDSRGYTVELFAPADEFGGYAASKDYLAPQRGKSGLSQNGTDARTQVARKWANSVRRMKMSITLPSTHLAMHYGGEGKFEPRWEPLPEPAVGEVLIDVEAAGLCGTDLHITHVPTTYPYTTEILGHEISGRVIQGPEELLGRRVVVDPTLNCGICDACRRNHITQCEKFSSIGIARPGGFEQYVAVPADRALPISDDVDAPTATIAEPLSCVLYALSRVPSFEPAGRAVVLGGGPIGLLFAAVLERGYAHEVVVVEPSAVRAAHIASRLNAKVVDPGETPKGFAPEIVVDATGFLFAEAVKIARPGGTIVCFGLEDRGGNSSQVDFTQKELRAVSARAAGGTFQAAIDLLERGVIVGEDVITAEYDLADINKAFDEARGGLCQKVVLRATTAV